MSPKVTSPEFTEEREKGHSQGRVDLLREKDKVPLLPSSSIGGLKEVSREPHLGPPLLTFD